MGEGSEGEGAGVEFQQNKLHIPSVGITKI